MIRRAWIGIHADLTQKRQFFTDVLKREGIAISMDGRGRAYERPRQSLGNKTPQEVYQTSSGGGAMIVDKYRTRERLPVSLRSSGTELGEVKIESKTVGYEEKTGAAPSSREKSSAT
jgi:hypothetical protein